MFVYLNPLLFPFLSFFILLSSGSFFKRQNKKTQIQFCRLSVFFMLINLILCFITLVLDRTSNCVTELSLLPFFSSNNFANNIILNELNLFTQTNTAYWFEYCFFYDSLTILMLFVVIGVSFLVQLFSTEYMGHDPFIVRFFSFLNFFSLCMLVLVTAGNFIQMFIGWEGVGLASFLLIGFWFSRAQAVKCALKAVIINRVGDCSLLLAFAIISYVFGDLSYLSFFSVLEKGSLSVAFDFGRNLFNFVEIFGDKFIFYKFICIFNAQMDVLFLIGLFILIGAFAKSAQFGLHTWLPDAMEGPTPVSALIHAATMVTAGVVLVIRCAPLFVLNDLLSGILLVFGSVTALFGASVAASQYDIKKIIAYSTCSQLGYMMAACGVLHFDLALFHLTTHAFFKAGLFLCAGLIIHALGDEQDIRKMGGLAELLPFTYLSVFICSLCLGGFPFLSGFFSKDSIIESTLSFDLIGYFSFTILLLSAFITIFYSIRFFYYIFWRDVFSGSRSKVHIIVETPASVFAVVTLSFVSIFLGIYFISGDFFAFFNLNSLSAKSIEIILYAFYVNMWFTPFCEIGFLDYYYCGDILHQVLPFSIFFVLLCIILSAFFIIFAIKEFFFRASGSIFLSQQHTRNFTLRSRSGIFFIFNHIFVIFNKAWLFDIFLAKISRLLFFYSRKFIQYNIETGLFEFFNVLAPIRSLLNLQKYVYSKTLSGSLSLYINDVVFGAILIFCFAAWLQTSFFFMVNP